MLDHITNICLVEPAEVSNKLSLVCERIKAKEVWKKYIDENEWIFAKR